MSNHLTLWIPGLRPDKKFVSELRDYQARLPRHDRPQLENLNLLLSRADKVSAREIIGHDSIIKQVTGQGENNHSLPMAQWRLAIDKLPVTTDLYQWMCADPVYIHPDRSEALLFAHEELDINLEEAQALTDLINQHYQDDPWQIHVGDTHRWYIQLEKSFDLTTRPLASVKGFNVFEHLPAGNDSRYWQQCMNEIQMLLHGCEINQQREAQGKMPVNSLWFWGYGTSEVTGELIWDTVYANDAVLTGLAICHGKTASSLPSSLDELVVNGNVLIYYDKLAALLQQHDLYGWLNKLQVMESEWFHPLVKKLKNEADAQVILLLDNDEAYQLTAKQLKRWWRRSNKNNLF